jgi:DNA-binding FadR family transcriptional regulator
LKAKGLLVTLLSYPDGYDMTVERIVKLHELAGGVGEGKHAIREGLKELRAAGLVTHTKEKGTDGKWRTTTAVSDSPEGLLFLLSQPAPGSGFQGS